MIEDHDFIAKIKRKFHDVGRQDQDVVFLQCAQDALHLFGNDHIQRGQRLIQQQYIRPGNDVDEHLHLVLHAMRKVFQQPVAVFRFHVDVVKVFIDAFYIRNVLFIDLDEKLQKFAGRQKFRHGRCGKHIAHILHLQLSLCTGLAQTETAGIHRQILIQAIEQRGLAGAVSAQEPIDLSFRKGKADIFQHLFFFKVLFQMFDH